MTTKFPSPLLGYNNNVRHKGKVFHIQTEDSGVKYGHIITHLFMDGGRILKSVKTSYAEYIGNERMADVVREMMKQQHKAMFIALRDGKFDPMVEGAADASQSTRALAAESPPSRPPPPPSLPGSAAPSPTPPPVAVLTPSDADRTDRFVAAAAPGALAAAAAATEEAPVATVRQAPAPGELTLDIESLERAAAGHAGSPNLRSASDLPPPPPNIFREKTATGKYRITPMPPHASSGDPASRPAPGAPARAPAPALAAERRYAPTRPASIFGQPRPHQGKSIFGEDLMSDKSLDEVILSYLAEDLDEKK
jgi:hypothetical protein